MNVKRKLISIFQCLLILVRICLMFSCKLYYVMCFSIVPFFIVYFLFNRYMISLLLFISLNACISIYLMFVNNYFENNYNTDISNLKEYSKELF